MADRNGYIGRAPSDSSVTVARQNFTPTGVQTNFTFASGYVPGYLDAYLNGAKLIVAQDFTATDGSVVSLTSAATSGDTLELVAFKAFNAANVSAASGDFSVGGDLSVSGSITGDGSGLTGVASTDNIITGTAATFNNTTQLQNVQLVGVTTGLNVSGVATFASNVTAVDGTFSGDVTAVDGTFSGNVSVGGTLTYEDVTNIDSVGLITARNGINVTGGDVTIGSATTVGFGSTAYFRDNAKAIFGDGEDLEIYHDPDEAASYISDQGAGQLRILTNQLRIKNTTDNASFAVFHAGGAVVLNYDNSTKFETTGAGVTITGVCTATSFEGSGANLTDLNIPVGFNELDAALFN